jgi:hypothetical protein
MTHMNSDVRGTFEVEAQRHPPYDERPGATLGRMTFKKRFAGEIEATSQVEMLSAMCSVKGSAGYVALERVEGTLEGRRGTFVLQHNATMDRGAPSLEVKVVPDSATGELEGLRGAMTIDIVEGQHHYAFAYTLP